MGSQKLDSSERPKLVYDMGNIRGTPILKVANKKFYKNNYLII